ncbi:flagellar export protein FliJ [Desulfococcus sp.]|uniref:flagellar export protein FliJ n=1 Tax=Desulfococcus sp. TaxID=2025834 RepID=UPI0035949384
MKAFKLEPVLRYRNSIEDALRRAALEKKERLNAETAALEALTFRRRDHLRELGEKLARGMNVSENFLYIDYLVRMDDEMVVRKKAVDIAEEASEIARGRLIEGVRQRKILERLKEKHEEAHRRELLKQETGLFDEIAVNRFNHTRKADPYEG